MLLSVVGRLTIEHVATSLLVRALGELAYLIGQ
jgi:hypothetical protein